MTEPTDRLAAIEARSRRVEDDKAWETSWLRRGAIAGITYVCAIVLLTLLGHEFGNEVLSREMLLRYVPIFVAMLVWLTRILFIGAGEMIELCATPFAAKNPKSIAIANRTLERGEKLASRFGGEVMRLADLPERLHEFDAVVSCTASTLPIIGLGLGYGSFVSEVFRSGIQSIGRGQLEAARLERVPAEASTEGIGAIWIDAHRAATGAERR